MSAEIGSDTVVSKGPCPKCGSANNNVLYADGHEHCFTPGCGHFRKSQHQEGDSEAPRSATRAGLLKVDYAPLAKRGLELDTLRRYGYGLVAYNGQQVQAAPYYSMAGEQVAQKLRFPDKTFSFLKGEDCPSAHECQLYGRHVFGDRFDRRVVVTEGELDAMSVAQVLNFKGAAVVSVNTGAQSAAKCLKANYLWLDRFDEIVLWLDDDEPGRLATEECARLFKVGKVRIAKAGQGFKDPSDLLQANLPGDIEAAIYKAQAWRPRGIINASETPADVLAPKADDPNAWRYDWPWEWVQDYLGPMLSGQVIYHVAGTGVGKTKALAEIEDSLRVQGAKIGLMHFEDTRRDAKLQVMTVSANRRLDIEPLPDADMATLHAQVFGAGLIELFDPETAEWTVDAILGYIRYMAKALDCKVIFVDPLSFIVAGMPGEVDERRALDKVSRDLAALAKELGICIHISHHLTRPEGVSHEEGAPTSLKQVRGSGGIANFASVVIGHERNQQADDDGFLITQLRSLKNRPRSRTGVMGSLKYNLTTGRLKPTSDPFPGPGAGKAQRGEFKPATEY